MVIYQVALIWLILCEAVEDWIDQDYYDNDNTDKYGEIRFIAAYELYNDKPHEMVTKLLYYSATTLTTIGLGDFHPKGDVERIICAFLIFFGVMLFTFISSNLIIILQKIRDYQKPIGDEDLLNKFIFTLYKFNGDRPIKNNLEKKFRNFFEFRWKHDMNFSLTDALDIQLFDQLDIPQKL